MQNIDRTTENNEHEITLRREVYRSDVEKLIAWMQDTEVTRHLNERQHVEVHLQRLLRQSTLTVLSAQFNMNGRFFIISHRRHGPIGFIRLLSQTKEEAELVIVIGERRHWGKGYGRKALRRGLRHALLQWRKERVVAKINRKNKRSRYVFKRSGFRKRRDLVSEEEFIMALDEFLHLENV